MSGVKLAEGELAMLIRVSDYTQTVDCSFGPGHVTLRAVPGNAWALDELYSRRLDGARREVVAAVQAAEKTGLKIGCQRVPRG